LVALALIAGMPGLARAQFTTFIPPVDRTADSIKAAVVAEQKAQQDSVVATQVTNMKTWVDSAAGLAPTPVAPVNPTDSVAVATTTTTTRTDTALVNGMRAPATASILPLLLVLGLGLIFAGVVISRTEPRRVRIRARHPGA
jgi:hypothetical protein